MARTRSSRPSAPDAGTPPPAVAPVPDPLGETTGRFLVLYREGETAQALASLKDTAGLSRVMSTADTVSGAFESEETSDADVHVFDKLDVAVVTADPSQFASVSASASDNNLILAVEPERIVYAAVERYEKVTQQPETPVDFLSYLSGYRDAVNNLFEKLRGSGGSGGPALPGEAAVGFADTPQFTWGLQATRVSGSRFTGQGVKVAILDTGFDLQHPDFVGRPIVSQSFVPGQLVQDGNRHGTHCTGTSLGPVLPPGGIRRYGCAPQASIYIGKVLGNGGSGSDGQILNGINWAITSGVRIISMSLSGKAQPAFSQVFETVARRALAANTLIIAAAGNDSQRPSFIAPVGHPANCPSIMAVAALDLQLGIAPFSNGGLNPNGGGIDIAGPGVNVFSSVPLAFGTHGVLSGTSMATPHVAGIAALHLQARGLNTTAQALWQILVSTASRLNLPARDVGAGLVQAP